MKEIEIWGPLEGKILWAPLISKVKTNKSIVKRYKETTIFIKDIEGKDFRIKYQSNNDYFEFIHKTKKGTQRNIRNEAVIRINKKHFREFIKILKVFGLRKGYVSKIERCDVIDDLYVWSFKKGAVVGNYWELEASAKLIEELKRDERIKEYLIKIACEYGFSLWKEKEFISVKNKKWVNINPVNLSKVRL